MPCLCQWIEQYYAVFCYSVVVNCVALFCALLACLFCVVLCYVVPCRVVLYYCIVPCYTASCCVVLLYRIVFYCTVLYRAVPCRAVPCCVVLCRVVHCRAEQCCPVLSCFVLPRDGQSSTFSDLFLQSKVSFYFLLLSKSYSVQIARVSGDSADAFLLHCSSLIWRYVRSFPGQSYKNKKTRMRGTIVALCTLYTGLHDV